MNILKISIVLILFSNSFASASASYKKLTPNCLSCNQIDQLLNNFSKTRDPRKQIDLALAVAKVIHKISLSDKKLEEQQREIYFAIHGAIEVLESDTDAQAIVNLIDLRKKGEKQFDEVFWHFPISDQRIIAIRMDSLKKRGIRPHANIPVTKDLTN